MTYPRRRAMSGSSRKSRLWVHEVIMEEERLRHHALDRKVGATRRRNSAARADPAPSTPAAPGAGLSLWSVSDP